jgi:hypothetical protein
MSDMKYLMLFEAFESNALSKMMKFLKSKVDGNSKDRFRDKLRTLINQLSIPIDKISDKDVKYLNRNQAIKLKNEQHINGDNGLYCLKFWFSLESGYLGFTGTGNKTMDFKEYIEGNRRRRTSEKNEPFNDRELNYIKNELDIKTGTLEPVKDYERIQHGQLVIGIFSDDEDNIDRLGLAKIWKENDTLFAIQNVASGGSPDNDIDGQNWRDYRQENSLFTSSWSLDSTYSPGSDHKKLHIYTPSDEPIQILGVKEKEEEPKEIGSPFDFNLPVNRYYNLSEWGDTSWSMDDYKSVERSDFAIVLMVDDVIKSVETKVADVKKSREESREGATQLMSNNQIKEANVKRYLQALVSKMGIKTDTSNLQNLQKLVLKVACNDFGFISIYLDRPAFDNLDSIIKSIFNIIKNENENDKKYYLDRSTEYYQYLNSASEEYKKSYSKSLDVIKKINNTQLNEFIDIIIRIGNKIKNYLLAQNIQSIEDLKMIIVKLKSIRTITREDEFKFDTICRNIINEFYDSSDVEYYCNQFGDRDITSDVTKAKHLERYVESLLR